MKTIAGINFTETGILIERNYAENPDAVQAQRFTDEQLTKFLKIAKRLAERRLQHCKLKLHANIARATHITPELILWEGGRFNVKVYESLESILKLDDVRNLNMLQSQQLIRCMLLQGTGWLYKIDEAGRDIHDDGVYCDEDFKLFITEHIICCTVNQ